MSKRYSKYHKAPLLSLSDHTRRPFSGFHGKAPMASVRAPNVSNAIFPFRKGSFCRMRITLSIVFFGLPVSLIRMPAVRIQLTASFEGSAPPPALGGSVLSGAPNTSDAFAARSALNSVATAASARASFRIATKDGSRLTGVSPLTSASKSANLCSRTRSNALTSCPLAGSVAWCE